MQNKAEARWRLNGVRVVHANELDINTPQTPGMNRAAAITYARAVNQDLRGLGRGIERREPQDFGLKNWGALPIGQRADGGVQTHRNAGL